MGEYLVDKRTALTPEQRRQRRLLLSQLIYEMEDGKPIYYAGYRDVLSELREPEEIMGSSGLQSFLIETLQDFLFTHEQRQRFRYLTNEVGV